MEEKKGDLKKVEVNKAFTKNEFHKKNSLNFNLTKTKFSMKKVGRCRNQKGHKNY